MDKPKMALTLDDIVDMIDDYGSPPEGSGGVADIARAKFGDNPTLGQVEFTRNAVKKLFRSGELIKIGRFKSAATGRLSVHYKQPDTQT